MHFIFQFVLLFKRKTHVVCRNQIKLGMKCRWRGRRVFLIKFYSFFVFCFVFFLTKYEMNVSASSHPTWKHATNQFHRLSRERILKYSNENIRQCYRNWILCIFPAELRAIFLKTNFSFHLENFSLIPALMWNEYTG